jgi:glucose/arabinose dehydrogenase
MGASTRSVESHAALLRLAVLGALLAASCSSSSPTPAPTPPQPPTAAPPVTSSPIEITGAERIGWDQTADDASQLAGLRYIGYVDDAPTVLVDAQCSAASTTGAFACSAKLPPMSVGSHRLELASEEIGGQQRQSARSPSLSVNLAGARSSTAARGVSRAGTTHDGIQLVVETLAGALTAPSALAATPDGRIFIAERAGDILVWKDGQILRAPALELGDVAQTGDLGLIGMAVPPDFSANGLVFVAYTARDSQGSFVNRVVRFREVGNIFGQAAVILEDRVRDAPLRAPRIRVGPGHVVYVAFAASDRATAESFSSYAGKILRINEDGTTPRDNQGSTPIISSGEAIVGGFDWQPATGRLWSAERDWQGRDFVRDLSFGIARGPSLDSQVDPSGVAFYRHSQIGGFANDLFIGSLAGRHVQRIHFSRSDAGHIESTERLLDGQYGRISDVVAGPDGALYICTSNAGAAFATPDDDRLLRLTSVN